MFPKETADFRHSWALVRKRTPDVVIIENAKMPSVNRSSVYNAQYCSLFFRPWTLLEGDDVVPHLSLLGLSAASLKVFYNVSRM